jgi:hypothetical protein
MHVSSNPARLISRFIRFNYGFLTFFVASEVDVDRVKSDRGTLHLAPGEEPDLNDKCVNIHNIPQILTGSVSIFGSRAFIEAAGNIKNRDP